MAIYKDKKRGTYYIDEKVKICDGSFKHMVVRGYERLKDAKDDYDRQVELFKAKWVEKLSFEDIGSATLKSIVAEYLRNYVQKNERSTAETVRVALNKWIVREFENKQLNEIFTEDSIVSWKTKIIETKQIKANRKNMILRHFRKILARAINRGIIPQSASKLELHLENVKDEEIKKEMTIWDIEDFKKFFATFDKEDKWFVFFLTYFTLGTRLGELRGLKVADFDYTNKCFNVYKQLNTRVKGGFSGGKWELKKTKTKAGVREVFIPDDVCDIIKNYIDTLKLDQEDFLFFGKEIPSENTIRRHFNKHAELAGLPHIRLHDVRHSSVTYQITLCSDVTDVIAVAQRSGHSNPNETLKTYLGKLPEQQKKLVKSMNIL